MITDKEHVNDVRRKLQSYTTFVKQVEAWNLKIEELDTKINSVASGSPKKLPEGTSEDNDWRSPLYEEIDKYKKLILINYVIIELIADFFDRLEVNDQNIILLLYLGEKKMSEKQVASLCGYTRSGLQKRVSKLIMEYWEY